MTDRLLTPVEVGALFRVHSKTIGRWAAEGRLRYIRTPSGRRRFYESEILPLLEATTERSAPCRRCGGTGSVCETPSPTFRINRACPDCRTGDDE